MMFQRSRIEMVPASGSLRRTAGEGRSVKDLVLQVGSRAATSAAVVVVASIAVAAAVAISTSEVQVHTKNSCHSSSASFKHLSIGRHIQCMVDHRYVDRKRVRPRLRQTNYDNELLAASLQAKPQSIL
jgi:hypothetical protein